MTGRRPRRSCPRIGSRASQTVDLSDVVAAEFLHPCLCRQHIELVGIGLHHWTPFGEVFRAVVRAPDFVVLLMRKVPSIASGWNSPLSFRIVDATARNPCPVISSPS